MGMFCPEGANAQILPVLHLAAGLHVPGRVGAFFEFPVLAVRAAGLPHG